MALLVTIIAGFLLLPEATQIDLPVLPAFDKHSVAALSALLFSLAFASRQKSGSALSGLWSRHWLGRALLLMFIASVFLTVMSNRDAVSIGARYLPGLRPYDGFSVVLSTLMMLLPLVLGRKFLARPEHHRMALKCLCYAGLAYSLLALFEIRMSPQINSWVYGFFPHEWRQHVRGGGYRPLVFLSHGLLLAIFFCATILAAFGLARLEPERRGFYMGAGVWLFGILILSKSLGALLITLLLMPLAMFSKLRTQVLVAGIIALIFVSYPMLRSAHLIPIDRVERIIGVISAERAHSLGVRLQNEDAMLAKANERPVFGWGGWGRSRVFDERGRDTTIADGYWIIQIGIGGWFGYLSGIGLLVAPLLYFLLRYRRARIGLETGILALILGSNLIDLIPNSSITPITWLVAGALWGRLELEPQATSENPEAAPENGQHRPAHRAPPTEIAADAPVNRYTRQTKRIYRSGKPGC